MSALTDYFVALFNQRRADALARARAAANAKKAAEAVTKAAADHLFWDNEAKRLNYYQDVEFANYLEGKALNEKLPGKPWTNPRDFDIACPTPAQWATLTQAQKDAKGSVRF